MKQYDIALAILLLTTTLTHAANPKTRVACLGDSITEGTYNNIYPTILGDLLGEKFEVQNFGVGATTLLATGTKPYTDQEAYKKAIAYKPDLVVVMLGTNDSKAADWAKAGNFTKDYAALLDPFTKLQPKPKIFLCTPPPIIKDAWGLSGKTVAEGVCPKVILAAKGHSLIDVQAAFKVEKGILFSDGVHPNADGAKLIAEIVRKSLVPPPPGVPAAPKPADTEGKALDDCLAMIRNCQLPDGAICQVRHADTSVRIWVAPYFAQHAALALLASHDRKANQADLNAVGRWLKWCAIEQSPEGYWTDFEGPIGSCKSNGKVDAWDSSAALFLVTLDRYRRSGGKLSPEILDAAKKALTCIATVTDSDGLTWAKPDYKVKFLMDNIEVYAGLRAASDLFVASGAKNEAEKAKTAAAAVAKALPDFWLRQERLFSHAIHENGRFEGGLCCAYPHGLAQLYGLAFIAPKAEAWCLTSERFMPDNGSVAAVGAERWLIAASRLQRNDLADWRTKVVKDAGTFDPQKIYVNRPAMVVLALLEGADWLPNVVATK